MKKAYKFLVLLLFIIPELNAQIILNDDFESGTFNSLISFESEGSFTSAPGIKDNTSFESSKVFGFGKSTCGSSCFDNYKTTLIVTFPVPTYVESITWKEMEIGGNWGSQGVVLLDDVELSESSLGALPINSNSPDVTPRNITLSVNQTVSTIKLSVSDITSSSEIIIDDFTINSTPKIAGYEYWFNNDFDNKITSSVVPTKQFLISQNIPTINLSNGINIFNFRSYDNYGKYTSTLSTFFYKMPEQVASSHSLVSYEYWFDNDYALATTVNTPIQSQVSINELINSQSLNDGAHTLNIRFKDDANLWSGTLSQFFYKMPIQIISNNLITNYRYWIDDNFAEAVNISLQAPILQFNLIDNIDFTQITKGNHTINFQFKDSLNLWSSVTTDTITKISRPISDFTYTTIVECDSTTINFDEQSVDGDTYLWDFGDGTTDTIANPTHTYYLAGWYDINLTVTDTLTLVNNSKQISVLISGNTYNSFSIINCDSYTSPSGNYTFTTSGIYNDTIPNHWACDSVLTIDVTIYYTTPTTDEITACDSYTWINGVNYTESNNSATYMFTNMNGCDSLVSLDLTINYSDAEIDEITACDNYTWIDGINYTTSNNTATYTLSNFFGCDSIITLNLTINQTPDTSVIKDGNTLTAIANSAGITYQWFDCNNNFAPLSGEIGQSFTATTEGSYAVEVSENDCADTSSCYVLILDGIFNNTYETEFIVYPNPTNGKLSVELGNVYPETTVTIYDISGKLINKLLFKNKSILEFYINDISGIYLIDLQSGNQKALLKVVKN